MKSSLVTRYSLTFFVLDTTSQPNVANTPLAKCTPPTQSPTSQLIGKPLTTAKMLANTSRSICALTEHVASNLARRDDLAEVKELELRSQASAFKTREEFEKGKILLANEKQVSQRIRKLQSAKDLEIIAEFHFKAIVVDILEVVEICLQFTFILFLAQFMVVYMNKTHYSLTSLIRHSFIQHPRYYDTYLRGQTF